ncbi:MAG: A/G-specific adenine glycosylase [Bdellovibrionota bacterium]
MNQADRIKNLQKLLLNWYRANKRELPWRKTKNSYFIWVSEIMLQQTRVDTAIPYYEKFLSTFPTVDDLAKASEHEVLKVWQGLGYYRRAKLIHKAAKEVSANYNGQLPPSSAELSKLPGFGPYTSGAVASIAFNECAPAVDGNVKRVLSRIFATHAPVEPIALEAAQVDTPSDWTQSLMELGAIICVPKSPKCLICPVRDICEANLSGKVEQFPPATKKAKVKEIFATTWMIQHPKNKCLLIQQRPEDGRWSNMWEFPTDEFEQQPSNLKSSITRSIGKKIGKFKHLLTHRTMHIEVLHAQATKNTSIAKHQKWITLEELPNFPFSKMQLKAFEIFSKYRF